MGSGTVVHFGSRPLSPQRNRPSSPVPPSLEKNKSKTQGHFLVLMVLMMKLVEKSGIIYYKAIYSYARGQKIDLLYCNKQLLLFGMIITEGRRYISIWTKILLKERETNL